MKTKQFKLGPMDNFSYLVWDEETLDAAVIDPAWQPEKLAAFLKTEGLKLRAVLLTHAHPDHVNAVNFFTAGDPELPVHLHEADHFMLETAPKTLKPAVNGEKIEAGALKLLVLHTPGHTPGGIALYTDGYVFTGDTLFVEAVGRTDLPGGSWNTMAKAIKEKLYTLPDETVVLPGHNYGRMPTSTIKNEKRNNLYVR